MLLTTDVKSGRSAAVASFGQLSQDRHKFYRNCRKSRLDPVRSFVLLLQHAIGVGQAQKQDWLTTSNLLASAAVKLYDPYALLH